MATVAMAATVQLVDLFEGVVESFKLLLTPSFGSDYELLCTDLSVQLLRIRVWADSVGLSTRDRCSSSLLNPLLERRDFNETTTKVIECISFLLCQLHDIRDKYMLKTLPVSTHRRPTATKSFSVPQEAFRLRASANQKDKSVFAIARWAIWDERRFHKKVKRLGEMISGLEDIARSVGRPPNFQSRPILPVLLDRDDTPPPYSLTVCHSSRRNTQLWPLSLDSSSDRPVNIDGNSEVTSSSASVQRHLFAMEAYLASFPPSNAHMAPRARDKLLELSHLQFMELCLDVYDELLRRQEYEESSVQSLLERQFFPPRRNEARRQLSTLVTHRFGHLVEDITSETRRRYPYLQYFSSSIDTSHASLPQRPQGCGLHWSTGSNRAYATNSLPPTHHSSLDQPLLARTEESQSDPAQNDGNSDIFTSYRVKLDDLCSTVLPAALRKYGVTASWEDYSLYIMYGNEERRVEMDEKPLRLFKALDQAGKNPCFMLRKAAAAAVTISE